MDLPFTNSVKRGLAIIFCSLLRLTLSRLAYLQAFTRSLIGVCIERRPSDFRFQSTTSLTGRQQSLPA